MGIRMILAASAAAVACAGPALAGPLSEFRVDLMKHDVTVLNEGSGGTESGFNIQFEAVFDSPELLSWAFNPRPYLNFSWNSDGDTNFGGGGLLWTTPTFAERFYGELAVGVVTHDGVVDLPPNPGDPVRIRLANERVIFGSRQLFRSSLAAGMHLNDRWDAAVVFEHLSHGQIFANGKNEGLDNFGVRLAYKFGD
jgi:lipid A 3-O-deacylase